MRELTRKQKQISDAECKELLEREKRGFLAVNGDDGYPYVMPMNHWYDAETGCIWFHCGRAGHRLDALRRSQKVSFCVCEQGTARTGEWALDVRSVIVFGRIEIIDDIAEVARVSRLLSYKFTSDESYIAQEIAQYGRATLLLKLLPEEICGKRVSES